jgi:DNA polymerase III subunit delta
VKTKDVRQISRALDNPDGAVRLYLLYGPDDSGSRALAARLDRAMGPDAERIDLDGATLKEDPARLADEAASFSLFGEKRHIRVVGGDECTSAVVALLHSKVSGNPVVMIAGALKATSSLLKAALDQPAVLAFQGYKLEGAGLETLASSIGRTRGLRLHASVAAKLGANCLSDRAILEREIEKLALYLDAAPDRPREANDDALAAIGADLGEADTSRVVNAVLGGNLAILTGELTETDASNDWVPTIRALQRRLILLARLRSEVDAGKSPSAVVASLGKSLFYKEHDAVTAQLSRWSATRLVTASARLFASEGAMMASGTAGHVIAAEELIAIARVAQRLR